MKYSHEDEYTGSMAEKSDAEYAGTSARDMTQTERDEAEKRLADRAAQDEAHRAFVEPRCYGCKAKIDATNLGGFCGDCLGNRNPRSTTALLEGYRD